VTEEQVEAVAAELAKIGGTSWYPGRERGGLLRLVGERYRDRARVAIAALERLEANRKIALAENQATASDDEPADYGIMAADGDTITVGSIVVYRPPSDLRAISCRVEKIENGRAYLVPCPKPDVGWVSLDGLVQARPET
jgi:hypothetical protein